MTQLANLQWEEKNMENLKPPTSKEIFQLLEGLIKRLGKRTVLRELLRKLEDSDDIEMMAASLPLFLWTAGKRKEAEQVMLLYHKRLEESRATKGQAIATESKSSEPSRKARRG